jgi:hypothetical protein
MKKYQLTEQDFNDLHRDVMRALSRLLRDFENTDSGEYPLEYFVAAAKGEIGGVIDSIRRYAATPHSQTNGSDALANNLVEKAAAVATSMTPNASNHDANLLADLIAAALRVRSDQQRRGTYKPKS